MAIPKVIYQTFRSDKLPWLTRWHIKRFKSRNPDYQYEFYDDKRIEKFFYEEFDTATYKAFMKLNIGAAKADMFRYAILYKKGGVYLDIDSGIRGKLQDFINSDDVAVITREKNHLNFFAQWALIYEPGHPFLERTLEKIVDNINNNRHPHDVHQMTGPSIYTIAINDCIKENPEVPYRIFGLDYNGHLQFKYRFGKFLLYKKGDHWKKKQLITPVLKVI